MKVNKGLAQWLAWLLLGSCLIVVYKTFDNLGAIGGVLAKLVTILTPFIVGFAIAFLLYAPVKRLDEVFRRSKWKWLNRAARPLSVAIVYLLAVILLALLVYAAIPALVSAIRDFINMSPTYYDKTVEFIQGHEWLAGLDLESKIKELYQTVTKLLTVERVLGYLSDLMQFATSFIDVLMAFIVSVYMLLGKESLIAAVKSVFGLVFKSKTMEFFSEYSHKIAKIFYNYFYSQAIDAVVVGVLATIGFLLARLPSAPVLGMMLGLMNMVPYFGALIGGVICVVVALLSGNFYGALFVAIYIIVMQQIDANIIQPRIVGQTVGIRPIYVLLGITVFGGLYGFWGIFLGAPIIAVIQMLLTDYIAVRNGRKKAVITEEKK